MRMVAYFGKPETLAYGFTIRSAVRTFGPTRNLYESRLPPSTGIDAGGFALRRQSRFAAMVY